MKLEYETEIVANMWRFIGLIFFLECLDAAPAITSPEFLSEKNTKTLCCTYATWG